MTSARTDSRIKVERANEDRLTELDVTSWPIWTKEPSVFDWHYDQEETCFFLEGQVTVTTDAGETEIGTGDLVTFPKGLSCRWHVREAVRKHYRFA